jgi:D-amino peptidase
MSENRKYMISVDIEGISGVATTAFSTIDARCYKQAIRLMCLNTNSVIDGILKADGDAQIIVRDAHGEATNLIFENLHPKASLIQGWGNFFNMVQGIDNSFSGVFLVGYHAGGQNNCGVLSHTLTRNLNWIRIDNNIFNEAGWAGILAGFYDVPIAFLSGDDQAALEAKEQFENIETVQVKQSISRDCSLSYPLKNVAKELEDTACKAAHNILEKKVFPLKIKAPFEVELKFFNNGYFKSRYQNLFEILSFDKNYLFKQEQCIIAFQAQSQLDAFQKFRVLYSIFQGLQ